MYLPTYIGAFIVLSALLGVWTWLDMPEENRVIDIMASREPDLALPVYAQFTVTQLLDLEKPVRLHHLEVPIYFPAQTEAEMLAEVRGGQQIIWRWRIRPEQTGVVVVHLPLLSAEPVSGQLELEFAAPGISHEGQADAPRLFVESADEQYPRGHYRIAENDKQGDVSLSLYEQRAVRDRLLEAAVRRPHKVAGQAVAAALGLLLVASLPSVLARTLSRTHEVGQQAGQRQR
jgi:hypothetical protein